MNHNHIVALGLLSFALVPFAQDNVPMFKTEAKSAVVWEENAPTVGISSTIVDPLTGDEIHRLTYGGIEVSSRLGYWKIRASRSDKLLTFSTTIANNTDSDVSVQYGSASVDGRDALPLRIAPSDGKLRKENGKDVLGLSTIRCFGTEFALNEMLFPSPRSIATVTVGPQTAKTLAFITRDPRTSAILCSVDGCHITGTIRYYVRVNRTDYVFVWSGRSIVNCGEQAP